MPTKVIEHNTDCLECCGSCGKVDMMIGAVTTDTAVITITVAGTPCTINIVSEERLPAEERLGDVLVGVATLKSTEAAVSLDSVGARGLMRLITRAIEVLDEAKPTLSPVAPPAVTH